MVKKPSAKQRYIEIEKVRATYDHKNDKIHITAKDPDLPDGFHITLNSGRKTEQSLRKVLTAYGLIREVEPAPASEEPNIFTIGSNDDGPVLWDLEKHSLTTIRGKEGRVRILENFVNHCVQHSNSWKITAINLRNKTLAAQRENHPDVFFGYSKAVDPSFNVLASFMNNVKLRREAVEKEDVNSYADLGLDEPTPVLIIDDYDALLELELDIDGVEDYMNQQRKRMKSFLEYIIKNSEIASVKVILANRTSFMPDINPSGALYVNLGQNFSKPDDSSIGRVSTGRGDNIPLLEIP